MAFRRGTAHCVSDLRSAATGQTLPVFTVYFRERLEPLLDCHWVYGIDIHLAPARDHPTVEQPSEPGSGGMSSAWLFVFRAPGHWDADERGLAHLPGREPEFRGGINRALEYAQVLECPRLHVMAGAIPANVDRSAVRTTNVANLAWAVGLASTAGKDYYCRILANSTGPSGPLAKSD